MRSKLVSYNTAFELCASRIDEKDQVQPSEEEFTKYWGWTRQQLYRASNTTVGHCNWIQAWKVSPTGDVTNGLPPVSVTITDMHGDHG